MSQYHNYSIFSTITIKGFDVYAPFLNASILSKVSSILALVPVAISISLVISTILRFSKISSSSAARHSCFFLYVTAIDSNFANTLEEREMTAYFSSFVTTALCPSRISFSFVFRN